MSDLSLRQNILDELEFEPSVNAAHIGVTVEKGVVTLSGHVGTYAEKVAAERATARIKGVKAIAQEVEVRTAASGGVADDEIAQRALNMLKWDVTVPYEAIQIKVTKGLITLTGEVGWHYERAAAENAVRRLPSVIGVANLISVRPRVDATDIKHRVEEALKRSAEVEASGIRVAVAGNTVTLEGKVHAWYERGIAEHAAWSAPGVSAVTDHLAIA